MAREYVGPVYGVWKENVEMTTSSYLERPIRKYADAVSDVEKTRQAECRAEQKARLKKKHALRRQRPAA